MGWLLHYCFLCLNQRTPRDSKFRNKILTAKDDQEYGRRSNLINSNSIQSRHTSLVHRWDNVMSEVTVMYVAEAAATV